MPLHNNLALAQLRRLPRLMPKFWSGEQPSAALLNFRGSGRSTRSLRLIVNFAPSVISESDGAIYKMNWTTEVIRGNLRHGSDWFPRILGSGPSAQRAGQLATDARSIG